MMSFRSNGSVSIYEAIKWNALIGCLMSQRESAVEETSSSILKSWRYLEERRATAQDLWSRLFLRKHKRAFVWPGSNEIMKILMAWSKEPIFWAFVHPVDHRTFNYFSSHKVSVLCEPLSLCSTVQRSIKRDRECSIIFHPNFLEDALSEFKPK